MASSFKTFLKFSFGTWINAIVSVITIPIITWFIAPEELGKATMFTLAYNLLLNIFQLGQDQSFARHYNEVAADRRHYLLMTTLSPAIAVSVLGIIPVELFRKDLSQVLFSSPQYAIYVDMLCFILPCGVISRFAQLVIRMQNKALTYSLLQIVLSCSNLLFTLLYAMFINADFRAVVVGFVASQALCMILGIMLETSIWYNMLGVRPVKKDIKPQLNYGLPFVPTFVCDWLFQSADRTFLRIYSTFSQIGIYATASRISSSLNILQTGFSTFWMPFVYGQYNQDENEKSFYQLTFESIYLAFSFAILLIISAKKIIVLILPSDYESSIDIFPLLLFVPMLYTLSEITGVGINLKKRTIYHFYILLTAALVSVGLGFFLIKSYGAKGAIMTNFTSYCVFFSLRSLLGGKLYRLPLNWGKFCLTFVLVLLPVMYSFSLPLSSPYWFIALSFGCIAALHVKTFKLLINKLHK